jgi:hypothetical protein
MQNVIETAKEYFSTKITLNNKKQDILVVFEETFPTTKQYRMVWVQKNGKTSLNTINCHFK